MITRIRTWWISQLELVLVIALALTVSTSVLAFSTSSPPPSPSPTTTESSNSSRRQWLHQAIATAGGVVTSSAVLEQDAHAAPPISVIAEELGYFPVQNRNGELQYVPKRIQRQSTPQAIELAKAMQAKGIKMYGAYWCPHCARQKEIFGQEAFSYIEYVECSPKGFGFKGICKDVDGYPTFFDKRKKFQVDGERPLSVFAQELGIKDFDPSLEDAVPMVGTSCRQP